MAEKDVGDTVHISDLTLPEGVESIALAQGETHDLPLVNVLSPRGGVDAEAEDAAEAAEAAAAAEQEMEQEEAPEAKEDEQDAAAQSQEEK